MHRLDQWSARARRVALLLVVLVVTPLFGGRVPGALAAAPPAFGPIGTVAIDNVGGGWAWTGPECQTCNGHLLRLRNGTWSVVTSSDPAGGTLVQLSTAIYHIALTGDGTDGWAIGDGARGVPLL